MADFEEPWASPICPYAHVFETRHFQGGPRRDQLCDLVLGIREIKNYPWNYEQSSGIGNSFSMYQESVNVGGGIIQDFGRAKDVQLSFGVSGNISGSGEFSRYQGFETRFTLDLTCPPGYSRFQWYLQGISQLNVSRCSRYVRMAVGKINEPRGPG